MSSNSQFKACWSLFNGFVVGVVDIGVLGVVIGISCLSIDIESIGNVFLFFEYDKKQLTLSSIWKKNDFLLKEKIEIADDIDDDGTEDFLIALLQEHEKMIWMLKSSKE